MGFVPGGTALAIGYAARYHGDALRRQAVHRRADDGGGGGHHRTGHQSTAPWEVVIPAPWGRGTSARRRFAARWSPATAAHRGPAAATAAGRWLGAPATTAGRRLTATTTAAGWWLTRRPATTPTAGWRFAGAAATRRLTKPAGGTTAKKATSTAGGTGYAADTRRAYVAGPGTGVTPSEPAPAATPTTAVSTATASTATGIYVADTGHGHRDRKAQGHQVATN